MGQTLLCMSPKAFEYVRKNVLPLPSEAAIREQFKGVHVKPGLNRPAFEFLRELVPKMTTPGENIATIMIDEMKLEERGDIDRKIDAAIGPYAYANQILVKSIFGDWEVPIYTGFDMAIKKKKLMRVIRQLEGIGIKVVFVVTDQGPRNLSLAKSLGIAPGSVSFENPADKKRRVFFSYDSVHLIESLRYCNEIYAFWFKIFL